jgi:hypothetical protein
MSQSPSWEQILETHLQTLAFTLRPSTVSYYRYLAHGFLRYLHAHFPSAGFLNCVATPTCSAGSAGFANNNRPCPTKRASTIWSASAAYSTTLPPTATPSKRT